MGGYYKNVMYEMMLVKKEVRKEKKRKENGKNEDEVLLVFRKKCKKFT